MLKIFDELPDKPILSSKYRRAPSRGFNLSDQDAELAIQNALRYVPPVHHPILYDEFKNELLTYGRIYAYRFRPKGRIYAKPIETYEGKCLAGKALQLMMDNNLDFDIALYPYELVTYGETGQVCQNWLQYRCIQYYLQQLKDDQTLVINSGHPLGLFPSHPTSPRTMITNALMVGMFNNQKDWHRAAAIGVANYGQMTAGGWMYIGPQGIVHGTFNTLLIAGRLKLGIPMNQNLAGKLFVSSGLGGMSGAQGKAMEIAGGVAIIAEIDSSRVETRHSQGWIQKIATSCEKAFELAQQAQASNEELSIAYNGNIVDLIEYAVKHHKKIDLLSDQTSCHAVYDGGYCPQDMSFSERTQLLATNKYEFKRRVDQTLLKHFRLIQQITEQGTYFFDYGNSFMKAVFDSGVKEIAKNKNDELDGFIWPSYVEDILGPELFDYGYGPFRWVCLSGRDEDLKKTDQIAADLLANIRSPLRYQDLDNLKWIQEADKNNLVVGSKARILYQDASGRTKLALRLNEAVRDKKVGPIMLGRDHHDTGGTDSPFRETANIRDGSNIMADMATQIFAGNAARGMSLVALHNGGGVGIGNSINGGYGLLLDGSPETDNIIRKAMPWDVMGGVARRAWAGNKNAIAAVGEFISENSDFNIALPFIEGQK